MAMGGFERARTAKTKVFRPPETQTFSIQPSGATPETMRCIREQTKSEKITRLQRFARRNGQSAA